MPYYKNNIQLKNKQKIACCLKHSGLHKSKFLGGFSSYLKPESAFSSAAPIYIFMMLELLDRYPSASADHIHAVTLL